MEKKAEEDRMIAEEQYAAARAEARQRTREAEMERVAASLKEVQCALSPTSKEKTAGTDIATAIEATADDVATEVHTLPQEEVLATKTAPSSSACRFCGAECGAPMLLRKHERACSAQ